MRLLRSLKKLVTDPVTSVNFWTIYLIYLFVKNFISPSHFTLIHVLWCIYVVPIKPFSSYSTGSLPRSGSPVIFRSFSDWNTWYLLSTFWKKKWVVFEDYQVSKILLLTPRKGWGNKIVYGNIKLYGNINCIL